MPHSPASSSLHPVAAFMPSVFWSQPCTGPSTGCVYNYTLVASEWFFQQPHRCDVKSIVSRVCIWSIHSLILDEMYTLIVLIKSFMSATLEYLKKSINVYSVLLNLLCFADNITIALCILVVIWQCRPTYWFIECCAKGLSMDHCVSWLWTFLMSRYKATFFFIWWFTDFFSDNVCQEEVK